MPLQFVCFGMRFGISRFRNVNFALRVANCVFRLRFTIHDDALRTALQICVLVAVFCAARCEAAKVRAPERADKAPRGAQAPAGLRHRHPEPRRTGLAGGLRVAVGHATLRARARRSLPASVGSRGQPGHPAEHSPARGAGGY